MRKLLRMERSGSRRGTSSGAKLILAAAATARGIQMREQRDLAARGWDALESYYNALDPATQAAAKGARR
jgi:hypothetical protein